MYREHFMNAPSQWEMTLHCNVVSLAGRIQNDPRMSKAEYKINETPTQMLSEFHLPRTKLSISYLASRQNEKGSCIGIIVNSLTKT